MRAAHSEICHLLLVVMQSSLRMPVARVDGLVSLKQSSRLIGSSNKTGGRQALMDHMPVI